MYFPASKVSGYNHPEWVGMLRFRQEQFAQQLNEVGETLLFMPRCYFLKTNESVSGMSIYNKLKSVLKDEDLFVLAPVKVADMNGWLATSSVTWLSNQE